MMTPLDYLKANLRIDGDAEDAHLRTLLDVAEERIVLDTHRTREELALADGSYPTPLTHAIIILAGHLYDEPGVMTQGGKEMPYNISYLIAPYRRLS